MVLVVIMSMFVFGSVDAGGGFESDPNAEYVFATTFTPVSDKVQVSSLFGSILIAGNGTHEVSRNIARGVFATFVLYDETAGFFRLSDLVGWHRYNKEGRYYFYFQTETLESKRFKTFKDYYDKAGGTFGYSVEYIRYKDGGWSRSYDLESEYTGKIRYIDFPGTAVDKPLVLPVRDTLTSNDITITSWGIDGEVSLFTSLFANIEVNKLPDDYYGSKYRLIFYLYCKDAPSLCSNHFTGSCYDISEKGSHKIRFFETLSEEHYNYSDFYFHAKNTLTWGRIVIFNSNGSLAIDTGYKQLW